MTETWTTSPPSIVTDLASSVTLFFPFKSRATRLYTLLCWSVCPSVGPLIHPTVTIYYFTVIAVLGLTAPDDQLPSNTTPVHPHATGVAVYPALFINCLDLAYRWRHEQLDTRINASASREQPAKESSPNARESQLQHQRISGLGDFGDKQFSRQHVVADGLRRLCTYQAYDKKRNINASFVWRLCVPRRTFLPL